MAVDAVEKIPAFQPNEGFDAIPMWVADMNFATAPAVTEAIRKRLEHPLFGYFMTSDEYFDSIIRWQERRNGVTGLEKEHIGYENGVLGGLMSALAAVCARGDNVLVHSPTYIGFTRSIENGGYHVITSPLKPDRYGVQRMDFFDMETKIKRNDIRAVVFCSPHNPTGRVWEQEELEQFMDMARRLNVTVISDEIWSDLTLRGHRHIPLQSVSDDMIEAAKIDGANEWHIVWNIGLPQCRSALYSIAILVFIDNWNMVEQPLILLNDVEKQPLSMFLSSINAGEIGIAFAAAVIYMIPGLLLFLHGEAYLVEGIAHSGSVKG